nr:DUF4158 domain-containing protein [Paenibacillus thiaminolyticus]
MYARVRELLTLEERLQYLQIPPDLGEREATKYEHLEEIRKEYGYQTFTLSEYRSLCKHLFSHAMANGNPLFQVPALRILF